MKKREIWKKAAAVLLSAAMVMGCGLPAAKAQEGTEILEAGLDGSSAGEEVYLTISSARELSEFARKVNNGNDYNGKVIKLTKDIVFDGTTINNFTAIGDEYYNSFQGIFDGDEHSVSGIDITDAGLAGLFGYIGGGGVVKNVTIKDSDLSGRNAGGIAVINYGVIVNCHNGGAHVKGRFDAGGIAGCSEGVIRNCSSDGFVEATESGNGSAGGIAGELENGGSIYNSCNRGDVSGAYEGGIAGKADYGKYKMTIQNCYNTGNAAGGGIAHSVGGNTIVADCYCSEESASYNFGTMNGTEKRNESFPASYMKTADFAAKLNGNRGSNSNWQEWELRADSEYPQLKRLTDLSGCTVTLSATRFAYTGSEIKPGVTVKLGGRMLTEGTDYSLIYQDNEAMGTGKVIISGEGVYKGSTVRTFVIEKRRHVISCSTYYKKTYGDGRFHLGASLKDSEGSLSYRSSKPKVAAVDAYGNVTVKGMGRAVIKVIAAATDSYDQAVVNVTVDIKPRRQALTVKSVKKRKIKISWNKDRQASGYQVQYGTGRKLSQSGKTKILGRGRVSLTLKNLKKKKTYYMRVRSFKKVQAGGKTIMLYGAWSSTRKAKTSRK